MDWGPRGSFKLLAVFDSNGVLGSIPSQYPLTLPAGATQVVLRVTSGGGAPGPGSDNGFGANPRTIRGGGGGGGGFAKVTISVVPSDKLASISAYIGNGGLGWSLNGNPVAFAYTPSPSPGQYDGGRGGGGILGDVQRRGGDGGTPTYNGGAGDHGAYGAPGSSSSGHDAGGNLVYQYGGGNGGIAGDYGDPDGVGIGWDLSTGERLTGGNGANRLICHVYGIG